MSFDSRCCGEGLLSSETHSKPRAVQAAAISPLELCHFLIYSAHYHTNIHTTLLQHVVAS